jgi:hypothetical protein
MNLTTYNPNPVSIADPKLVFSNILTSDCLIKVFNLSGMEMEYQYIDTNTIKLNNISQGVYIIKIIKPNGAYSIKFAVID